MRYNFIDAHQHTRFGHCVRIWLSRLAYCVVHHPDPAEMARKNKISVRAVTSIRDFYRRCLIESFQVFSFRTAFSLLLPISLLTDAISCITSAARKTRHIAFGAEEIDGFLVCISFQKLHVWCTGFDRGIWIWPKKLYWIFPGVLVWNCIFSSSSSSACLQFEWWAWSRFCCFFPNK